MKKFVPNTEAMQKLFENMIVSLDEFNERLLLFVYRFTNSSGAYYLVFYFEDGKWAIMQPIVYDQDAEIELVDEYTFENYHFHVLTQAGVCTKEEHEAERAIVLQGYYDKQVEVERRNALETLKRFPDLLDSIRNGELP